MYNGLSNSDKRILSAMILNIFGDDWKSSFVIVENKNNEVIKKAVEIAVQEGVEIFDLSNKEHFERIQSKIIKTEKQYEKEKTTFLTSIGQKPYKNVVCKLIK
jgi:saccharopine dehydrogenase-like NADP-dependent oxidoreductase